MTMAVIKNNSYSTTLLGKHDSMRLKMSYEQNIGAISALIKALGAKDKYTKDHSFRVSQISEKIGRKIGATEEQLKALKLGGLVHDIGKFGVPDGILNKPGKLSASEYEIIKQHPINGELILKPLRDLAFIKNIIRHHHERLDGSGYPDGLFADEIAFEAKIVAVADVYDAISSDRPYRPSMSTNEVIKVLEEEKNSGKLDVKIVDALIELILNDELELRELTS